MAASKNAPPSADAKAVASKMHRRSRSGTFLSGVHELLKLAAGTDMSQVASLVDYGERSVRKASLPVKHANTWACDAITSDQCGGAMAKRDETKRS